ncbi:MAG: aldo/keto reductase, partial [Verrucomicrobiae bacterium]|nr:aldo/keto reductase [Verrucomicrobiae bacterium]
LVEQLRPVADKAGMTLAQLAIKFVLQHVAVSVVIPGARNRQQVEQNFAGGVLPPLTTEERAAIETALGAN